MMKIGIIGGGVVGKALARCFMECAEVRVNDTIKERSTHTLSETLDVGGEGLVFICLPTPSVPQAPVGWSPQSLDLSCIENLCSELQGSEVNLVLKSTIPIGTTTRLVRRYNLPELIYSPEFLTQRCAFTDVQLPARNIIGGRLTRSTSLLYKLYEQRFPGVHTLYTSPEIAEAIKLLTNAFFAVKVSFFNEARSLCDVMGIGWDTVLRGILMDGRISASHTQVPGHDGERGFGGGCLPKDLECLIHQIEEMGLKANISRAALERNKLDRRGK